MLGPLQLSSTGLHGTYHTFSNYCASDVVHNRFPACPSPQAALPLPTTSNYRHQKPQFSTLSLLSLIGQASFSTSSSAHTQVTQLWSPQHNMVSFRILIFSPCVSWLLGCSYNTPGGPSNSKRFFLKMSCGQAQKQNISASISISKDYYECQPLILKASKTVH